MDIWEKLIDKLDSFPTGAPRTQELYEILQTIFTEGEARLAADLSLQPYHESIDFISRRTGGKADDVRHLLEAMADKGLVFHLHSDGQDRYALLPLMPGIFELQFMKGETSSRTRKLAKLFDSYYYKGWGEKAFDFKTPFARTIAVEAEIPVGQVVYPYDQVHHLIESTPALAITKCYCRHEQELLGKGCGAPLDVCMLFGPFVDFAVKRGFARPATKTEMFDVLDRAEEAGLVHLSDNIQEKINFICNCCGCCCGILGTITRLHKPGSVATSSFTAIIDEENCVGCGTCIDRCHVKAISLVDQQGPDEKARLDAGRCIGCGLCVSTCPNEALTLVVRDDAPVPKPSFSELGKTLTQERRVRDRSG